MKIYSDGPASVFVASYVQPAWATGAWSIRQLVVGVQTVQFAASDMNIPAGKS